jgi:dihydroorotate dehydrogenase
MIYERLVRPWLFRMDPEDAHQWVMRRMAGWRHGHALLAPCFVARDPRLTVQALGLTFPSPVGLAAGLDKHGEATHVWPTIGFGFYEVGTVTPAPQSGNPRPRVFRLPEQQALINRMGFNSVGAVAVRDHIHQAAASAPRGSRPIPRGINVGKNRDTPNEAAAADYVAAIETLAGCADYFVINISSPNTTGLRSLQQPEPAAALVQAAVAATRRTAGGRPATPVLVKLAPDLEAGELAEIVDAVIAAGAQGLIATNTTLSRAELPPGRTYEAGGLSGRPLTARATTVLRHIARAARGRVPLIGVGGIQDADDAYQRIRAGATLLQIYTGFIYHGPALLARLHRGLLQRLERDRLPSLAAAVGLDSAP